MNRPAPLPRLFRASEAAHYLGMGVTKSHRKQKWDGMETHPEKTAGKTSD